MASPTSFTRLTEASLSKLTAKELKLLCKDRRLTSYSKLTKAALILKILNGPGQRENAPTVSENVAISPLIKDNNSQSHDTFLTQHLAGDNLNVSPKTAASEEPNSSVSFLIVEQSSSFAHAATHQQLSRPEAFLASSESSLRVASTAQKRLVKDIEPIVKFTESKRAKFDTHPITAAIGPNSPIQLTSSLRAFPDRVGGTNKTDNNRRFRHLVPKLRTALIDAHIQPVDTLPGVSLESDDSLESCSPRLSSITFPPSMAQRKHVPGLSLILRDISVEDLKSCILVSRLFRYCAYSAAYNQLRRKFAGSRLNSVFSQYPVQVTNFWPYLLGRINEAERRKKVYEASFVGRYLKNMYHINESVWKSCNDQKEAAIVMRFLLTQLFFIVSVGQGLNGVKLDGASFKEVTRAEEVIAGEIWKITVKSSPSPGTHQCYVIEPTCEIIGRHTESGVRHCSATDRLRLDWEYYIECKSQAPTTPINSVQVNPCGLSNYIHWLNHEEYDRGISKIWLSKIKKEDSSSSVKLVIAQRHIIACVVSNSFSGAQLTLNEMIQQYNGIPLGAMNKDVRPRKNQRIRLFLPEHHHLESLHFDTVSRKPLHEALAIVQTPARQYYILKDNGMQIGSEEDGVADIWMEILGCKNDGST